MKIGIYGGSFNPIHNGHLHLAREARRQMNLDEVWLMVSPHNPLKKSSSLLRDELRLELVRIATQNEEGLSASDFEFSLQRPSFTWNTMQALSLQHPEHQFSLLVGADNWSVFHKWYAYEKILQYYPIIIYPRRNSEVDESNLPHGVTLLQTELIDISSTEVRRRVAYGLPIDHLVPECVAEKVAEYYSNQKRKTLPEEEEL
ncbi:MAG: nicotinate-nucleotide adenylyltransferase [Prevotella sp.]|nr:nicotinate-nucleotide adenylyltransferase [Prevotella sp.]